MHNIRGTVFINYILTYTYKTPICNTTKVLTYVKFDGIVYVMIVVLFCTFLVR